MKISTIRGHVKKTASFSVALWIASMAQGLSQFKAGEAIYVVVNFVPKECKEKIDGLYRVSKDGKISFPFMDVPMFVDRDAKIVHHELSKAIQRYCDTNFPDRRAFPDFEIIPEADVEKAGDGVLVMGQAKKSGVFPMRVGLTVFQAVQDAGGPNEFSALKHVTILRKDKIIDCDFTKAAFLKILLKSGDVVNVPRKCMISETGY
jgi:protein involved in polysaccharide export with SLBB domain